MSDNDEFIFEPHNDIKVPIIINQKEYQVSTRFSMRDSEKYTDELTKENDYKKAIAVIIFDKLSRDYGEECPQIEIITESEDVAFTEYILAVVSANKELRKTFADTDDNLPIRQRFSIAHQSYIDRIAKQLADIMQPMWDNYANLRNQINHNLVSTLQNIANTIRPTYQEVVEGITRFTEMIADAMQPFQQIATSIAESISKIKIPTVSQEEQEQWEKSYKQWGGIGWPVLPNADFNFFSEFPNDVKTANKLAMEYCDRESMSELFENLHEQNIKKEDLDSAIFCYKNKQYKACALMIFCLIDSKLIKLQSKDEWRASGLGATSKLKGQLEQKINKTHVFITALYHINLMTCLETYFANGNNFVKEPYTINRNFIDHGMNTRAVRKRDCIQLFLALYNLLEFLDFLA